MNLPSKKRPGNPVLASDWNQLVDAVAARTPRRSHSLDLVHSSGGFYYRAKAVASAVGRSGRFIVTYDQDKQRLYVSPGSVFTAKCFEDKQAVQPTEPTLEGTVLAQRPYWDVGSKPNGTIFNVWCIFRNLYTARMELRESDESLNEILDDDENAVLIAEVSWKSEGDAKMIDTLTQFWESDIGWFFCDGGSDSSGSDGEESSTPDDSSGDPPPDSSDEPPPDSSGDDSDSDSSSSSSSSSGCSWPQIMWIETALMEINGSTDTSCMPGDEGNNNQLLPAKAQITVQLSGGVCKDCAGDVWVRGRLGNGVDMKLVGSEVLLGSGDNSVAHLYYLEISFLAWPCSDYNPEVSLVLFGSASGCPLEPPGPTWPNEWTTPEEIEAAKLTTPGICAFDGSC